MTKAASKPKEATPGKAISFSDLMKLKTEGILKREPVNIPEWGGPVYIQELTGSQQEEIFLRNKKKEDDEFSFNDSLKILMLVIVDETGKRIFEDEEKSLAFLREQPGRLITMLVDKSGTLNDLGDTEQNLPAAQASDSASS